jgi:hypothetical protein
VEVLRFQCSSCPKTISVPTQRLPKHRQYCVEAMMPLMLMYLLNLKSYELCVWYPLNPSTLWRWMRWACQSSDIQLRVIQRRLVEAWAPLMAQSEVPKECPNTAKARLSVMRNGLDNLRAIVELAGQFLPEGLINEVIWPAHTQQRYPPQSPQCALF